FELEKTPLIYLLFFGFSLTVGLLAGAFPAFSVSGLRPIQSLKKLSHLDFNSKMGLRKALVVAQFTLSLLFILAVVIVLRQQSYVMNADLGIRTKDMLNVRLNGTDYDIFKQQALEIDGIEGISGSDIGILTGENQTTKVAFQDEQDSLQLYFLNGTTNYIDNHDIELLAGQNFPNAKNDQGEQFVILNQKTIERMGYPNPESAIGGEIIIDTLALSIVGVVADFHHDQIWWEPIQFFGIRSNTATIKNANLRLAEGATASVVSQVHQLMNTLVPNDLASTYFMEERIYFMTKFFKMGSRIIGFIGGLTILISCMGLLGMVIYNVEGRVKEVGIRKVLGASAQNITWQLSKSYLLLLGIAILIAVPVAVLGGNLWLQFFYLRTTIQPFLIIGGVVLILAISMLTVFSQTWFAAQSNPVNSLRSE
ncbi:MAG: FtsX-like permease family protein, partial [Bacteroidota bacterium]